MRSCSGHKGCLSIQCPRGPTCSNSSSPPTAQSVSVQVQSPGRADISRGRELDSWALAVQRECCVLPRDDMPHNPPPGGDAMLSMWEMRRMQAPKHEEQRWEEKRRSRTQSLQLRTTLSACWLLCSPQLAAVTAWASACLLLCRGPLCNSYHPCHSLLSCLLLPAGLPPSLI